MGSSNDGLSATQEASAGLTDEPPQDLSGRGFFGRILSAFSPNIDARDPDSAGGSKFGLAALRQLSVDDVAVPKADIISVPLDIALPDLVAVFRTHGFSRLPVYNGTLDHPQGLILFKDLALEQGFGPQCAFSLKRLLRPMLYVPPSMPAGVLLQKMQKERAHMALVIDEYGGVDGLVTIEDLIETVLGEIEDEHDEDEGPLWREVSPGVIVAQSTAPLEDLEAAIGFALRNADDDDEIDTIGGLVFLRLGHMPAKGEIIAHESGASIEILEADARRIKTLRLRLRPSEAEANGVAASGT